MLAASTVPSISSSSHIFRNTDAVTVPVFPFFHIGGSVLQLSLPLACGQTVVTSSRYEARRFLQLIQDYRVGFCADTCRMWY